MSTNYILINRNLSNGQQSWVLDEIGELGDNKLRTQIRRNAYNDQSTARISVWTGIENGWTEVASLPITECACSSVSYTTKTLAFAEHEMFDADVERLVGLAAAVLA